MKTIKILIASLFSIFLMLNLASCEEDRRSATDPNPDDSATDVGGFIRVGQTSIAYTIGNGTDFIYKNRLGVSQKGAIKVNKIYVYKSYFNTNGTETTVDDKISNEVLFRTFDVPLENNSDNVIVPFDFTYPQLIQDLLIDGVPLPTVDTNLNIGDSFLLRYEQLRSDGKLVKSSLSANSTKVGVGTRLAGKYKAVETAYYRIGVLTGSIASWDTPTVIESVDSNTYRVVNRWGPFKTDDNSNTWTFDVNGSVISYPNASNETANGQTLVTCETNPSDFSSTVNNCGTSNKVVLDNVGGKDRLYMTIGYVTPGSGPRILYQLMEKIVE